MQLQEITLIVPTRNEEKNILPFLASVPPGINLIVVDASQDKTADLVEVFRPARTVVLRRDCAITEARQLGAHLAATDWLLFSDADVVFSQDYFDRLGPFSCHDAVYGAKLSTDHYVAYYRWMAWGQGLSHHFGIPAASGSNLLIRRSALSAIGGFDLCLSCNEDSEVVWRLKQAGYSVAFAPQLVVYARDHRRLQRGAFAKTMHTLLRCFCLYMDIVPAAWRSHDWGYWSHRRLKGQD